LGGKSFFDDFEGMFAQPFNGKRDSILKKQFEYLNDFNFSNDSTVLKFNDSGDLFKKYGENKKDSIPSKSFHNPFGLQSKSMEEMMQMLQLQMEKMEENQRKYFNKPTK